MTYWYVCSDLILINMNIEKSVYCNTEKKYKPSLYVYIYWSTSNNHEINMQRLAQLFIKMRRREGIVVTPNISRIWDIAKNSFRRRKQMKPFSNTVLKTKSKFMCIFVITSLVNGMRTNFLGCRRLFRILDSILRAGSEFLFAECFIFSSSA